jgi:hypothetical protein
LNEILFQYQRVQPTSWAYLATLLSIALLFKFNRLFSVRNLDIILLSLLAPGLLCVRWGVEQAALATSTASVGHAKTIEVLGYIWLFSISAVLLVRAILDSAMIRRPLLEPNMNVAGMSFLAISLFCFLMANVINGSPTADDIRTVQRAEHLTRAETSDVELNTLTTHGPGFTAWLSLPHIATKRIMGAGADVPSGEQPTTDAEQYTVGQVVTARTAAILSQLAIVVGMVLVGARHFDNISMGVAAATLYLILPYTAMWTGSHTHTLPAALLVWAIYNYRRPVMAGILLGLACGTFYYPVFLLPLWFSYYWRRGAWRLLIGVGSAIVALLIMQIFVSSSVAMYFSQLQQMFGFRLPQTQDLSGVWHYWYPIWRLPILAAFIGFSVVCLPIWPVQKNLGSLISCSAAVMLGTQFWHAHSGGLALAWYLPLFLLMVFRPNLEDRTAVEVVR